MNLDISRLLDNWEYQPGQVLVRRIKGRDGTEKIQLRVDLGILQMNTTGRPDGKRPMGHDSWFDHYLAQLGKVEDATKDSASVEFTLNADDCARLQQEFIQYHHRYICLFQLRDYEGVLRDTERNLDVLEFVEAYAATSDLAWSLLQFFPQVLMMRARAEGSLLLRAKDSAGAGEYLRDCVEQLRSFYSEHARPELIDQSSELQSLQLWLHEIEANRPLSRREKLEQDLRRAVESEDYERAARVRDMLRNLRGS
jgi:hypothetical protein